MFLIDIEGIETKLFLFSNIVANEAVFGFILCIYMVKQLLLIKKLLLEP